MSFVDLQEGSLAVLGEREITTNLHNQRKSTYLHLEGSELHTHYTKHRNPDLV